MRGSDASRKRPLSRTPRAPATLRALLPLVAVAGLLCPSAVAAQVADTAMVGAGSLAPATPLLEGCRPAGVELAPLHLDRARVAEIQGRSPLGPVPVTRPAARRRCGATPDPGAFTLRALPAGVAGEYRSRYPGESLNGLRWNGRGASFQLTAGVEASWGPVSAALAPAMAYHQNKAFEILPVDNPGSSPYAWFWRPRGIDWPQRFGEESFWWGDFGDSYIRVDYGGAAAGFSTEGLRWGPARRNPLLMSGAAPGFPHVFLGTSRPVDIWIARLAVEAVWGHLAESDYFDLDGDNDRRMLAGLVASLEPRGVPGLELGIARAYLSTIPPGGLSLGDYITEPYTELFTNRAGGTFLADNELFSFFGRWVFPASELEVYAEFAREDQWDGWKDLIQEPEHSAGITAGLQKLVPLGQDPGGDGARTADARHRLRLAAEVTSMNFSETQRTGRPEVIFYTHSSVRQGYTHRGQLLGAPIGPSADAQSVEVDYLGGHWLAGLELERVRYANDIYWQNHADRYTTWGHDVEFTGRLRGAYMLPNLGLELAGALALSGRYNRDFIALTGIQWATGYERNVSVWLGASWSPASARNGPGDGPASPPGRP